MTTLNTSSFIWGIADDVLRDVYVRGKYRDVILPMTVIRRLGAVLEPTKDEVRAAKERLDAAGITNQDQALREVGWEKWTPKSDKLERRRCQDEEGPARKVYQGIPAGSSEAGIGRESVIARGRASVVLTAIDVGVLGEAI